MVDAAAGRDLPSPRWRWESLLQEVAWSNGWDGPTAWSATFLRAGRVADRSPPPIRGKVRREPVMAACSVSGTRSGPCRAPLALT